MKLMLTGFKELEQALHDLPKSTGKAVLRRVGKKALEPMREKAEQLAPRDTGDLASDIVISEHRTRRVKKEREPVSGIQIAMGPASGKGVLNYAALNEFGTVNAPPQPYMRPAYDSEADGAMDTVMTSLLTEVQKSAQRHARKLARKAKG